MKACFRRLARLAAAATTLAVMLSATGAHAQFVWGGASSDYNSGSNWTPSAGAPPVAAGQTAQFDATGSTTVIVTGTIAPDSWTFTAASQNYTVSGGQLNFGGAGLVNAGGTNSISNNITGGGISVTGGSLTLSGNNTYAGNTTVNFGTLALSGSGSIAASALASASAEWKWINGWSAAGTFEGEFSNVTTSYAGKGVVRYAR